MTKKMLKAIIIIAKQMFMWWLKLLFRWFSTRFFFIIVCQTCIKLKFNFKKKISLFVPHDRMWPLLHQSSTILIGDQKKRFFLWTGFKDFQMSFLNHKLWRTSLFWWHSRIFQLVILFIQRTRNGRDVKSIHFYVKSLLKNALTQWK